MWSKLKKKFKFCLSAEILIEYKACLYFGCILAFACFYLLYRGIYSVSILHLFEMMFTAYLVGYLQVYVFHNFDEAKQLDLQSVSGAFLCTGLYTLASCLSGWFERNFLAEVLFALYMLLVYFCIYLINKIKRAIDTEHLNGMLTEFKKGEKGESTGGEERKCN